MTDRQRRAEAVEVGAPRAAPADDAADVVGERVGGDADDALPREGREPRRETGHPEGANRRCDDVAAQSQVLQKRAERSLGWVERVRADVDGDTAEVRGDDPAAHAVRGLHERHADPDLGALERRHEPGEPSADDDDARVARTRDEAGGGVGHGIHPRIRPVGESMEP